MKLIIHDLGAEYEKIFKNKADIVINANGKYSHCFGCFNCWTKHPAECYINDSLKKVCRTIGSADEVVIISRNCFGSFSPEVKNILDRSIGGSTPFSVYRNKQMHHGLRYGMGERLSVYSYGDLSSDEKETFEFMTERNAINLGYKNFSFTVLDSIEEMEGLDL